MALFMLQVGQRPKPVVVGNCLDPLELFTNRIWLELQNLRWRHKVGRQCFNSRKTNILTPFEASAKVSKIIEAGKSSYLIVIVKVRYEEVLSIGEDVRVNRAGLLSRIYQSDPVFRSLLRDARPNLCQLRLLAD